MNGLDGGVVPVLLRAWGPTDADVDRAVRQAEIGGPGRVTWRFTRIERLTDAVCPIPAIDGAAIAVDSGQGWAYAAYRAEGAT